MATQLERDLSMSSGVTRWLYWLEALEKAAPSDFPRLARLAQGNSTVMRLVAARWVDVAPRHLFDTLVGEIRSGRGLPDNELITALLDEWPKRDPEAAIAALSEADNPGFGDRRWRVAYTLLEKDIERGLQLLTEWHADDVGFGPRGIAAVATWTRSNPRHAAEFLLERPNAYSFRSAIETVGNEWAKTDPASALACAVSKPGELGSTLATAVLKEWAGRNLTEAANWLADADARTRNRLGPAFVEVWAKQDTANALTWCEDNLTGSSSAQAVGAVVTGAAERDVTGAARLVTAMNPSPVRAEAAVAVARKLFPELSSAQSVAPETVGWLVALDPESVNRVLDKIAWGWATSDPKSMAAFVAASSREQVPSFVHSVLGREFARRNPEEALAWASHLPEDRGSTAGGAAFAEWRRSQPEAAMKWLNGLPATDARRQSYFESVIRSLAYEPQAAEQLAAMDPTERAAARSVIATMNLPNDRRTRLLEVLKPQ